MQSIFDAAFKMLFSENPAVRSVEIKMFWMMLASLPLVVWMHVENNRLRRERR